MNKLYRSIEPNTIRCNYTSKADDPCKPPEESNDYECIEMSYKKGDKEAEGDNKFSFSTCAVYGLHSQSSGVEEEGHYASIQ